MASAMDFEDDSGSGDEQFRPAKTAAVGTVTSNGSPGSEAMSRNPNVDHTISLMELPSRSRRQLRDVSVAVLLPCKDEVQTIGKVVRDFRTALPNACVYVFDNASTDGTAEEAARAGAVVRFVSEPGKGNVIRSMFAEVEADVYVVADGDDTYDASRSPELVELLISRSLDMVVGSRIAEPDQAMAYPRGHRMGNSLFNISVRMLFGVRPADMLTGYRVFSRRFAKSFPCISRGFEVETELTLHAMDLRVPVAEVPTTYKERSVDSASKLRTLEDGFKILGFLLSLFHSYKPLKFYGTLALISVFVAGVCALAGGTVVAVCLSGLAVVFALLGAALACVRRGQRELKRMIYLSGAPSLTGASLDTESADESTRILQHIAKQVDMARSEQGGAKVLFDLAAPRGAKLDA